MAGLIFPKPKPHLLAKRKAKAELESQDRAERKKCHIRSGGRCEVVEITFRPESSAVYTKRCARRASQNHHLKGGIGRRNRGASILAEHRLDVCDRCHQEITGNVLVPVNRECAEDAATVRYERIKE